MYQSLPFRGSALALAVALTSACSDNGSSNNLAADNAPVLNQASAGQYTMSANGGDGYVGGAGGAIQLARLNGGAKIAVQNTGSVSLTPSIPAVVVNTGTNPASISSDTLITDASAGEISVGELYFYGESVFRYDGATESVDGEEQPVYGNAETEITGLTVEEGATLTLQGGEGYIYFSNDILVKGTLTSAYNYLNIEANALVNKGAITLPGGDLEVNALLIENSGSVSTSAEADSGEDGGDIEFYALGINNSGSVTAEGGSGLPEGAEIGPYSSFGHGGDISLTAALGQLNSGSIDASAAISPTTNNNDGGEIELFAGMALANTGSIDSSGNDSETEMAGSDGGSVSLTLAGGMAVAAEEFEIDEDDLPSDLLNNLLTPMLINTGSITVDGGSSAMTKNGGYGSAGHGGGIYIAIMESFNEYDDEIGEYYEESSYDSDVVVNITGELSADGGDNIVADTYTGALGGDGGNITLVHQSTASSEQPTAVIGYSQIEAMGGNGVERSGLGGYFSLDGSTMNDRRMDVRVAAAETVYAPASSVELTTDVNVSSGALIAETEYEFSFGREGGYISVGHLLENTDPGATVNIEAALIADSTSVSSNSDGVGFGSNEYYGIGIMSGGDINVSGTISAKGGDAESTALEPVSYASVDGNDGAMLYVYSGSGNISIASDVNLSGGSGANRAGDAGDMYVEANGTASFTGNLVLNGGNADASIEGSTGGNGGELYTNSGTADYTLPTSYSFTAGAGAEAGVLGSIWQDGNCFAGLCLLISEDME